MSDSNFRLPGYFATGMVIQQKVPLRVPGVCAPEREVSISLFRQPADGHIVTDLETQYGLIYEDKDRSDRYGRFNFKLPALEASLDPCTLILSCDDANMQIEDILVGEIWFAAGQDNMAMPVASCDLALRLDLTATMNHIRIFAMAEDGLDDNMPQYSYHPVGYIASGRWYRGSHPEEMAVISGIAYSFALRLEEQLLLPIGIYDMGCAGTYIHSWLPREIIEQDPYLKNHVRELHLYRDQDNWNSANPAKKKPGDQENSIVPEKRTVRRLTLKDNLEVPQSGNFQTRYQPATMFNHKLAPFIGLGVRGVLWYQGESDADSPDYYTRAFPVLVSILKEMFVAPENELRLIYSQIAAYCYPRADARTVVLFNEALSDLRRKLPVKSGMVTISDLPLTYNSRNETYRYPAHPVAKEAIGRRMASIALGLAYGYDLPSSAPEPKAVEKVGNKFMIDFEKFGKASQGLILRPGTHSLEGFAICGAERIFVKANARILYGVKVIVWHDELADPVSLTYAYANFNREANLTGPDGMPVPAFRLDMDPADHYEPQVWMKCDRITDFAWAELLPDPARIPEQDWPGERELWTISSGRGELKLVSSHENEALKTIKAEYRNADERPLVMEPQFGYASSYPPLNLSGWGELNILLHNPDLRTKRLGLEMEDENQVVYIFPECLIQQQPHLQVAKFNLSTAQLNLERIVRISFAIQDPGGKGSLDFEGITTSRRQIWQE